MNRTFPLQVQGTTGQDCVRLSEFHPVRLERLTVFDSVPAHDHQFLEVVFIESGSINHEEGNNIPVLLEARDVVVIPEGGVHAYHKGQTCRLTNLYFLSEWFLWGFQWLQQEEGLTPLFFAARLFRHPAARRVWTFRLTAEEFACANRELHDLEIESERLQISPFFVRGALSKLLMILARAWCRNQRENGTSKPCFWSERREMWQALDAMEVLLRKGETLSVESLAHTLGLATGSFSRLFRETTGLQPTEYFQSRRVQHAAQLLLQSEMTISQISYRMGYDETAHL